MINNIPVDRKDEIEKLNSDVTKLKSTVNAKANTSDLEWKLAGSATSNTSINLPSTWKEILIQVVALSSTTSYIDNTYSCSMLINKAQLSNTNYKGSQHVQNYYMEADEFWTFRYAVTSTSVQLTKGNASTTDYMGRCKTYVYYR